MNKNQFLIDLSESKRTKFGKELFSNQSVPQKVFSSVWSVEGEVNNGGFGQYFVNSGEENAPFVIEALTTIGAPRTADICRRAFAVAFPSGIPSDLKKISESAREFSEEVREKLSELDDEFLAYPHDLTELLFAYISRHPDEFGTIPTDLNETS